MPNYRYTYKLSLDGPIESSNQEPEFLTREQALIALCYLDADFAVLDREHLLLSLESTAEIASWALSAIEMKLDVDCFLWVSATPIEEESAHGANPFHAIGRNE